MDGRSDESSDESLARGADDQRASFSGLDFGPGARSSSSDSGDSVAVLDNYKTDKEYYRPDIPDELKVSACTRCSDWACGGCKCMGCSKPTSWIMLLGGVLILGSYAVISAWFISAFVSINWGASVYRVKTLKKNGENQNSNAMWWVVKANGDFVQSGTTQFNYEDSDTAGERMYLTPTCSTSSDCEVTYSDSTCDSTGICVANAHDYMYGVDGSDTGYTSTRISVAPNATTARDSSLEAPVVGPIAPPSSKGLSGSTLHHQEDVHGTTALESRSGALKRKPSDPLSSWRSGDDHEFIGRYRASALRRSLLQQPLAVSIFNGIATEGEYGRHAIGEQKKDAQKEPINAFRPRGSSAGHVVKSSSNDADRQLELSFLQTSSLANEHKSILRANSSRGKIITREQLDAVLAARTSVTRLSHGVHSTGGRYYMSVAMLFGKTGNEANATAMANLCDGDSGGLGLHEEDSKVLVYSANALSNYGPNAYCAESSQLELVSWNEDDLLSGYIIMDFSLHDDSVFTGSSATSSVEACLDNLESTGSGQIYWQLQFYCAESLHWFTVMDVVLDDLINIFIAVVLLWYEIIEFCVGKRKVWYERFAVQCLRVGVYFIVGGQLVGDLNQYWVTIGYWALAGFTVLFIFMHCFFCFAWVKVEDDDQPMFGIITHWFDSDAQEGARVERDSDGKFRLIVSDEKKEQLRRARKERGETSSSDVSDSDSSEESPRGAGAGSSSFAPSRDKSSD